MLDVRGLSGQVVAAADAWDIFRVRRVVGDALASSSLDSLFTNANVQKAMYRVVNQPEWEAHRVLWRRDVDGKVNIVPFSRISKSWFSPEGRFHIRGALYSRCERIAELAGTSTESVKLLTLTIADAKESWTGSRRQLRDFLQRLRVHFRRKGYKLSYLWVAEMQNRLALHYHVLIVGAPFIERDLIGEWWPMGTIFDIRTVEVKRGLSYILKYVRKGTRSEGEGIVVQQVLHSGMKLRRHGCTRDVSRKAENAPVWVRELVEKFALDWAGVDWAVDKWSGTGYVLAGDEQYTVRLSQRGWKLLAVVGVDLVDTGSGEVYPSE